MSESTVNTMVDESTPASEVTSKNTANKKAKPGFLRRLLKTLFWIVLFILLLFLLALAIVWFLAGTDKGFDLAMAEATKRVPGLEITQPVGNLNTGIGANDVTFKNDSVNIEMTGVDTEWQTPCLAQGKFCFDRMVIDKVRVESLLSAEPKTNEKRTEAIELPNIDIPLDVNIDNIHIKEFVFQPPGDAPEQVVNDIRLQAENVGSKLRIKNLSAVYKNFDATASGDITLEDGYPLDINIVANATDVIEEHDFSVNLRAFNSVKNLSFEGAIEGAAQVSLSGTVKPLEAELPVTLQVNATEAGWPLDTRAIAKARDVAVTIDGDINDFNVAFNTQVSGQNIPESTVAVKAIANPSRVLVPNITVQTLDGFATGSAAAKLGEQISWITDIIIKDINPSKMFPEIKGSLNGLVRANGGVHDGKWMLNLKEGVLNGEMRGIPFDLNAVVSKSYTDQWNVEQVVLNNGANRVNAQGSASEQLDFDADINLTQLQNFLPGLAGGFSGKVKVSGSAISPSVDVTAKSDVLKYDDVLITGLTLDADVVRDAKDPSSLNLKIGKLQKGTQVVQNTRLNLDGTREKHRIKFFADGPSATAIDLTAEGALTDSFDWLGELQNVLLEVPAHKITLAKPFDLGWNNELKKARIGAHCWKTEETRLCLKNEVLAEQTGTAVVALTRYPLNRLDPFLPAGSELQGKLQADATIQWGKEHPGGYNAKLLAKVDDGGIKVVDDSFDELMFTYDTFTVDSSANGETMGAKVNLQSKGLGNANINVQVDATQEPKPLTGDLTLKGFDISFIQAFLPQFDEIGGEINANGTLSGKMTDPRFNGQVILDQPRVQAEVLPLNIDGGRVTVRVDGKRAKIRGGLNSGEGKLNVSGTADWSNAPKWASDILIKGKTLNVQTDPLVESAVDAEIRLALKPGSVRVRGDVEVPMARIEVAEVAQGAVSLSDDVVIIEDEEAENLANQGKAAEASETNIDVKLNVSLGKDVRLEAFGLKAQLDGDMAVAVKPPRPPQLSGAVRIVEGIFKQYGQDLLVEDGEVLFVGPVDKTRLNMDAVRVIESEDRVAGLRVAGPLAEPEVTLFTNPADKSQDSILSYILLGRDINQASDQEQNLLAQAALALTLRGGRGKATEFAEAFGVQEFTVDARGRGDDTEVVVSGRLSDKLLLRYGRNVFSSGETLYLRYDISRKFYLEATRGAARAVDFFYNFSF